MARSVICLGVFAGALCLVAPASAHQQNSGFIAVTKLQIDPHMGMLSDGPDPQQAAQQKNSAPQAQKDAGVPLDQMGSDEQDADAPAGDDPYSDNAVETDTVYTA